MHTEKFTYTHAWFRLKSIWIWSTVCQKNSQALEASKGYSHFSNVIGINSKYHLRSLQFSSVAATSISSKAIG